MNWLNWSVIFVFISLYSCAEEPKVLYVDTLHAFEKFRLTQELKEKTNDYSFQYQQALDSITLTLKLGQYTSQDAYQNLVYRYNELEKARSNEMTKLIEENDKKIWTELNKYFREYGLKKDCKVILGGTGNGNILYCSDELDETEDFVEYINQKYEGE